MNIKYTYKEPNERPIKMAEFLPEFTPKTEHDSWKIVIEGGMVKFFIPFGAGNGMTKDEWGQYTDLVNRINRQIGNE